MGFFDFLKSKPKEEKKIVELEIKFENLSDWLESHQNEILSPLKNELENIQTKVEEEKNLLRENLKILESAQLINPDIPEKVKQIMEGNRQTYIQKLNLLLDKIIFPEQTEKVSQFAQFLDKELSGFDKAVAKNHLIMEEFFGKKASVISVNVQTLDKLVKDAKAIIENSEIKKLDELKNKFGEMQNRLKRKEENKRRLKLEKENVEVEEKILKEREKKLKALQEENAYKEISGDMNKKESLETELINLRQKQSHFFSEIEPALKKYHKNSENKLAFSYLEAPLETLVQDSDLEILNIFAGIKESVSQGSLELKDKKKDKILRELENADKEYFQDFQSKHSELTNKIKEILSQMENSKVFRDVKELKEKLEQDKMKLAENKVAIDKMEKEIEEADVNLLKTEFENQINLTLNEKVKIV